MQLAKGLALLLGFATVFTACSEVVTEEKLVTSSLFECQEKALPNSFIVHWENGKSTKLNAKDFETLKEKLSDRKSRIKFIEPNYKIHIEPLITKTQSLPEDPTWGPRAVGAEWAWNEDIGGQGVIVAVIDSGVDLNHPQLRDNIFINQAELNGTPGVDDDLNGYIDDIDGWDFARETPDQLDELGHGTHVSGIISTNHSRGQVLGVAPQAKIMALDFIYVDDYGNAGGTEADAVEAIDYAVANGARVINASWGSGSCSKAMEGAFARAEDSDVFIAVAAGNEASNLSYLPLFPAVFDYKNQLTVGATTIEFYRAQFSNYGLPVHLVAPGEDIYSTYPPSLEASGYRYSSGTSMATPFVAGLAALMFSKFPEATSNQVRNSIIRGVNNGLFDVRYNGEIDVENAIKDLEATLSSLN